MSRNAVSPEVTDGNRWAAGGAAHCPTVGTIPADALLGRVHVGYGLVVLVSAAGMGFLASLVSGGPD